MKRWIIYIGILAVVIAAPVKPQNIGKMKPVQIVSVYKENDWVVVETDTEDIGLGSTTAQALQNLKDTASGIIYLDTAQFLVASKDAEEMVEELRGVLKPSVRLCLVTKKVDLAETAKFLDAHEGTPKLKDWRKGQELPVLSTFGDSLIFFEKSRK